MTNFSTFGTTSVLCSVLISISIIGIFNINILLPILKVSGFHQGILKLAMEPSLLGTALMEGGPDRKIKLDRNAGVDEVKSDIFTLVRELMWNSDIPLPCSIFQHCRW